MDRSLTRRGLIAALVTGGTGAAALAGPTDLLETAAPLSGRVWRTTGSTPGTVESPHGEATITYDDYHVPHVEGGSPEATYFAVGYAQAADRLTEMDLLRRQAGGRLAELVGEPGVESDVFRTKLDFEGAAAAAVDAISGTEAERVARAYVDGVNAYIDEGPPGLAYGVLGVEPEPWRLRDTMLALLEMGWRLNGGFRPLRLDLARSALDRETFRRLYPDRLDHGTPILQPDAIGGSVGGIGSSESGATEAISGGAASSGAGGSATQPDPAFVDWLSGFEGPEGAGSNCWTVSGEFTESGQPILCSDPHLGLQAPPIWYQQRITTPETSVRGVAVPGTPFTPIGENDHCAWGITNVGANAVNCYDYEIDGDRYRYRGEWREFDETTRTVPVDGGEDRTVTVRKTVHGPLIDREIGGETQRVGLSWVGFGGVRDAIGVYRCATADSRDAFLDGLRHFDVVLQNVHYADRDGHTLYRMAGSLPIRRVDGEVVPNDRVFDGSAGEAEWAGYEPYGQSSWSGFVPFEELPHVVDPDFVASANQRTADDPSYPISTAFAPGFRAQRLSDRLQALTEGDEAIDLATMAELQLDVLSVEARLLVPAILDAADRFPDEADPWVEALENWDYRMQRDSEAALFAARFATHYREELWSEFFDARDLPESTWPSPWLDATMPAEPAVLDRERAAVVTAAVEATLAELDDEAWETYGDYNVTAFDHPLGGTLSGLNYDRLPTDGGTATVRRLDAPAAHGASYRQVVDLGGSSIDVLPGGNDGSPFSAHYQDQLSHWADGEYREAEDPPTGESDVTVEAGDR